MQKQHLSPRGNMPRQTFAQRQSASTASQSVVATAPVLVTDEQLRADKHRCFVEAIEPLIDRSLHSPIAYCEQHCIKLAANYWKATYQLRDLLDSRAYTQGQVNALLPPMVSAYKHCIDAYLQRKQMPLTKDEAYALEEKTAIIQVEMAARVLALQFIAD